MPTIDEFRAELRSQLRQAELRGAPSVDIVSGDLHRKLGGYPPPAGGQHQMPSCCQAMYAEQQPNDVVVYSPPKGKGATLTMRYKLPR